MMEGSRFQYVRYLHSSFFKQSPEFIYIKEISLCAVPAFQQSICKDLLSPCCVLREAEINMEVPAFQTLIIYCKKMAPIQ